VGAANPPADSAGERYKKLILEVADPAATVAHLRAALTGRTAH
jgi:hypothetical protein